MTQPTKNYEILRFIRNLGIKVLYMVNYKFFFFSIFYAKIKIVFNVFSF